MSIALTAVRSPCPCGATSPDSPTVDLAVAIISSESDTPAPDPVVYLHGGPGGAAVVHAEAWLDPRSPLLAERDLILVDQRGSGFSRPSLDCPELDQFASGFGDRRCRLRLLDEGIDLAGFTTVEIVADLDDLRRALGHETWNLYGGVLRHAGRADHAARPTRGRALRRPRLRVSAGGRCV